ncbi:MAG: hypothetical protein AB1515_07880 [Nitrospirota bacterium]
MPKAQVTIRIDRGQLTRAQKALGAETVTEAIQQALALATEKAEHDAIIRRYGGVGKKESFADR